MATGARKRTTDEILDALGDVQRRKLLIALLTHNPQDDSVVVAENESADEELMRMIKMQHIHLPKLEEYGFIDWIRDTNEVSKGPNFEEIRPLLELLRTHENELPDDWL